MRPGLAAGSVLVTALGLTAPTRAHPDGTVPSLGSGSVTLDYSYELDRSQVERERVGDPSASPGGMLPVQKDLVFHQNRHVLVPRLELGFARDAWAFVALPIVIAQARDLKLDDGVSAAQSSTLVDGLLPAPTGNLVFRGPDRHGLDQIHLGIGIAPMNQQRDDTKPTWKMTAELRIPVGRVQRYDPTAATDNTAVGSGTYELRLGTSFDRRLGWAEPWVDLFWQVPIAYTNAALFESPGFGATNTGKQQQAGVAFGFDALVIDDPERNQISLELGARATAHFEGRDYSEMWEVFAAAGHDAASPLVLDGDPTMPGVQALAHPGISNIENYLETAARLAVRAALGPNVRFAVLTDVVWKTDHVISFADSGVDNSGNNLVDPGTKEINPLHNDRIDLVGHRYLSTNNFGVIVGVQGTVLF